MGLFSFIDKITKKNKDRSIANNRKTALNRKTMHEERKAAIEFFCHLNQVEIVVPVLLERLCFSVDHGINDEREKEVAKNGILNFGEKSLPFVKEQLKNTTNIAWPVKIILKISSEKDLIDTLKSCLEYGDIEFDKDKIDKNEQILSYLQDYQLEDSGESLIHFLEAHNERVRFATVEAILSQKQESLIRNSLEHLMSDKSSENNRIRQKIADFYWQQGWPLEDKNNLEPEELLDIGFSISKTKHLEKKT